MEYSNKLDEVDLAWDNLQEAKSVLQQIENKLNSEEDDLLPEPSIQKCLKSEAPGCSVRNTSSLSNTASSPHQPTSMTNSRLDSHRTLPHSWTPSSSRSNNNGKFNYKLDNCGSSGRMFCHERINPSCNDIIDQDAHLSGVSQTTITINQKSSDNPSTRVIPTRLQVLADWDTLEKGCHKAREQDVCSRSNKYYVEGGPPVGNGANLAFDCYSQGQTLQEKKSSPEPFISSLSPPGSPLIQCLELKGNKSPTNKLERLKERIRVQRKLQKEQQFVRNNSNLPQEQPIPFLRQKLHKDGSEKCLVRKVTFAPPAPAYKGFNAVKLISEVESCMGTDKSEDALAVKPHTNRKALMRQRDYGHQEADNSLPISIPEQRRKHQQNSSRDHEATRKAPSCSKTINLKETAKVNGSDPSTLSGDQLLLLFLLLPDAAWDQAGSYSSDVFSWKQGQRLIRMLLGPPPKPPQSLATTPDTNDRNSRYLSDEKVKDPEERTRSSFERSPKRLSVANEDNHCCNSTRTGSLDSGQPRLEAMQINGTFEGLQSEKTAGMNQNFTWQIGDDNTNMEGKYGEENQKSLGTPRGDKCLLSHEDQQGGPNHWSSSSPRNCAMRQKPYLGGKRRPLLPEHRAGSSSPLQSKAEMENQESRARSPVARSYNAEEVREYMNKQVAKRRRKESERKRSARQAMEMKKKRLQEVYRKQKEAISKQKRWRQRGTRPAHHYVDGCKDSTRPGKSLGSAHPMKGQTPTRDRPESGDLAGSGSHKWELKCPVGSSRCSLPGQCSPLRIQGLDPLRRSPPATSRPLATREQEPGCHTALRRSSESRDRQQRIEALRSMASALSGRIEDEAKRLGVDVGFLPGPGGCGSAREQRRDGSARPVGPHAATWAGAGGPALQSVPRTLTDFGLLPNSPRKAEGQAEAERPKDTRAGNKTDPEVKELVDELLRSPSSQSGDFLWSDSESWSECDLLCKARESSNQLLDEDKGLVDQCEDDLGTLGKGNHPLERKASADETALDALQPESWSLCRRRSWETSNVQDGNKSFLIQKSQKLDSHWSPSRTMPTLSSGGKQSGIVEHSCNSVRSQSPRNSGLCSHSRRPLDDSRPVASPSKVTTNEMVKRKEDPLTQRLAELMKQLQEETEELSFRCRMNTSLKEDSVLELRRSSVSPDSSEHLRNSRSSASADISVDGKGTAHASVTRGSLTEDKLMEPSLWSLLPSESHYRRTMENIKHLHSGDSRVRHRPSTSLNKLQPWEEPGRPVFGNQNAFNRFTLEMAHQYLKEEDLRARHQAALFRLREKALTEKTKAELAWLEHQKIHLQDKGQDDKRPVIIGKQREVLLKLQKEKAEIRHLQTAYQVAHQERKLLLKQQQEIFRIHQSTAHLQWQLSRSATGPWFLGGKNTSLPAAADNESTHLAGPEPDPDVGCSPPQSLLGSEGSLATDQLKEVHRKLDERFLSKKEEELIRRRRQAMDVLAWKQPLDVEEQVVHGTETEALATWSPQVREQVPGTRDPSTETDNRNAEECSHSSESTKHLEINRVMTLAADFSLDELNRRKQNVKPSETRKQIPTVLEPSENLVTRAAKVQSEKDFLISETAAEPTVGETHTSPLRRELPSHKEMLGSSRSEQRRRQREKLKMEEAELCRQLEAYDAFISRTQAELILDDEVNHILKPQIKTPAAAQVDLPRPQRSSLLQHSPKQGATILQPQDLPSEQDEKAKDVAKASKPQEVAGSMRLPSPGKSETDEEPSHGPNAQLPPPSHPIDEMQSEGSHAGTSKLCVHPEWSGSLDIAIKQSDPSSNSRAVLQYNGFDSSACNRTKSSNGLLSIKCSPEQNAAKSPSKEKESLFQRTSHLHPNEFWNNFPTKTADHSSQNSCQNFVKSNTIQKAGHWEEFEINQSSAIVTNAKDIKENGFGFPHHSANISGFMPSFSQQPALELRINKPTNELGGQERIITESPPRRTDNLCKQASVLPPLNSSCPLKEDASLAHCQQTAARNSRTAEVISPESFIDDFPSTERKSEDMEKDLLSKRDVQSSVKSTLCTNEIFPSLPQEVSSLRSATVEEVTWCNKDQVPLAEGIASGSVELQFLNAEGVLWRQQDLLPVLKSSCKKKDLAIPLIDSPAEEERIAPLEEISFTNEELPSPAEEDNPLSMKELNSQVDELMLYETEVPSSPAEGSISFETEEFPPLPEEVTMFPSKELPSPSRDNGIVHIEDLAPSSAGNSSVCEASVGDKDSGMNTDEFTHLPPPLEEMVEERKSSDTEKYKCSLRTNRNKETPSEFCGHSLLLEPSRIHLPQTKQQMVDPLRCFTIRNQVLVDNKEPDSLKVKELMSFGQDYWADAEKKHDGAFCERKYMECTKKCNTGVTPEELFHHWDYSDVNTDVTDSEGSFSEGSPILNQSGLDDGLKQAHSFEEESEMKLKEKGIASQVKNKRLISDQGNQGEAHCSSDNDLELEWVILECAKAVESFVDSEDLLDAEMEPKLHLEDHLNSEGLVCTWAQQHLVDKDSELSLNDTEGYLTEYLVEGTLGDVTRIRDQKDQSTQRKLSQHQINRCSAELTRQNCQPVKGQRGHDRSYKQVTDLLRVDCMQLQDKVRITKVGCSQESIENVTRNLITEIIDDATKVYIQIKRKYIGNTEAKLILYSQPAVECLTPLKMMHNAGISGNSQDIGNEKLKGLQPFPGTKTHGQMLLLDHWCSAPLTQSEETTFVVPHNFIDIHCLVGNTVDALWSQSGQPKVGNEINVLEFQEDKDTDEMDADGKSKRVYKQVNAMKAIFDLTSDIFQNALKEEPKTKRDPWMKARPRALLYSGHSLNKGDKTEVKIQELQEEESHWVEYADDELAVKMKLTEDIFNILIHDTADIFSNIFGKKLAEQELTYSGT